MNTPAFLLLTTLAFWGWHIERLEIGLILGVVLESHRIIKPRWDLPQEDLDRIWNLCVILFVAVTVYIFTAGEGGKLVSDYLQASTFGGRAATLNQGARVILNLFQWIPVILFPIALTQAFLARDSMELSTFSWWLRRRRAHRALAATSAPPRINVAYLYFAACLFSSSAAPQKSWFFMVGLAALVGWALWTKRPSGFAPYTWGTAMLGAVALGVLLQFGLIKLRDLLQELDTAIISRLSGSNPLDFKQSRTALGSVGRLKLSGKILWRLEEGQTRPPELLREASYNLFTSPIWASSDREFNNVISEADQQTWILKSRQEPTNAIRLSGPLPGGKGLLPLAPGTLILSNLPVFILQTNTLGMVRSEDGPGFLSFLAAYESSHRLDRPPDSNDLQIAAEELPGLQSVAMNLQIPRTTPEQTLTAVKSFFANEFSYSLWGGLERRPSEERTALAAFLTEHRSGHCEYFATATALLLRKVGLPTRYNVGYAVHEKKGDQYVIRARHAHAWCQVWIHDHWEPIDTTPASWFSIESQHASPWESLRDFLTGISHTISRWRWGSGVWKRYLSWLVVPLVLVAFLRLILTKPWRRAIMRPSNADVAPTWPGQDSDFYLIEKILGQTGLPKRPHETPRNWLKRVTAAQLGAWPSDLQEIVRLHYRLRFDPLGLSRDDRRLLKRKVETWLAHHQRHIPAKKG